MAIPMNMAIPALVRSPNISENPEAEALFAWSVHKHSSKEFRKVRDQVRVFMHHRRNEEGP